MVLGIILFAEHSTVKELRNAEEVDPSTESKNQRSNMSRRRQATKRPILPDPLHGSPLISVLVNAVMKSGKKSVAQRIVYGAIERMAEKVGKGNPVELVLGALENIRPKIEVKSRRVGGATYQVPVEVRPQRREALAIRWLIKASRDRNEKTMKDRLASELIDAVNTRGSAVKKKEDTHKMAEANKAFSHYRW